MKGNSRGRPWLPGLMSTALLAVAGLAVVALGPGLLPSFAFDGTEALAVDRPVAPPGAQVRQPVTADTPEAVVLANWEYTQRGSAARYVEKAVDETENATIDAVEALLAPTRKAAKRDETAAANAILLSVEDLALGAAQGRNLALLGDALAMLNVYMKAAAAAKSGNVIAVLEDTFTAETIAIRATREVSPFR